MIVYNAHRINRGESPRLNAKGSDFFFERAVSPSDAAKRIVTLCSARLPGFLNLDPVRQMQVLSPTKKGECGVWMLNQLLQAEFNPPASGKHERVRGDTTFREGDKVMQDPQQLPAQMEERRRNRHRGRARRFQRRYRLCHLYRPAGTRHGGAVR